MQRKLKVYYMGDELVEVPSGKMVSLDVKDLSPRENIYIEYLIYKYTVQVSAEAHGTVIGGGNFFPNEQVTVSATPDEMYDFSGWYVNGIKVSDSSTYSFTVSQDVNLVAIFESAVKSIGGRIYYVDNTATGGVYHFYDANGNELTTHTVDGLANAVTYYAESKASKDKFYVYATENGSPSGDLLYSDYLNWDIEPYSTVNVTSDGRYAGKANSEKCLPAIGNKANTIWNWLKGLRDENFNGCNDWFIGSKVNFDDLQDFRGPVGFYSWAAVEKDKNQAYFWRGNYRDWYYITKFLEETVSIGTPVLRSF